MISVPETRRSFLRRAAIGTASAGAAVLGYTWRVEPHWVEVVRRDLPIAGLPSSLVGKTLVQLSDLHVGDLVDFDYLKHCLAVTTSLQPEVVVVTGDWMTCQATEQVDQVARLFEGFARPPLGVFGITGNHDFGHEWRDERTADALGAKLDGLGITLLRNAAADVGGLNLIGLEDSWSPRFDGIGAERLFADSRGRPRLMLCHNPDVCDFPIWRDYQGWILSGHTHGGQCKPPFLRPPLLPVRNKRYTSGEFVLAGDRRLYINRGAGYLRRVRFNCRPEITAFTLRGV